MKLNYITLKVINLDSSKELYESFGFDLNLEKHGEGPEHYSFQIENIVFEIYPWQKNEKPDFNTVRIGLTVTDIVKYLEKIETICRKYNLSFQYSSNLKKIELKDFENRTIELMESH